MAKHGEPVDDGAAAGPGGEPAHDQGDVRADGERVPSVVTGTEPGTEPGAPSRLEDLEHALGERNEQYRRLAADFENFKRRKGQELEERSRYASEDAARELLPVLDNLQRALAHVPEGTDSGLLDGLSMVVRAFEEAFDRLGVTVIATDGQPFDPALHEAVIAEESADADQDMVAVELQRGYRLHDRVMRPAMVKVVHPAAVVPAGPEDRE